MHENIIIIKSKQLDLRETCEKVGNYLVNIGHADYYTTPLSRGGQLIEGQIVMDLKKFQEHFLNDLQYAHPNFLQSFFILSGDAPFKDVQWEDEFIYNEFFSLSHNKFEHLRQDVVAAQSVLMTAYLRQRMAELRERPDEFEVCYLDIHR